MRRTLYLTFLVGFLCSSPALAQDNKGFQLNRFEPTPVGEWSFLVDHPWYSTTRYFAAGVSLNYAHNPLVLGLRGTDGAFNRADGLIAHQLTGHLDLAGSFADRVLISAMLPLTLLERGTPEYGVTPLSEERDDTDPGRAGIPAYPKVGVGDPRLGIMARLYGQPYRGPFSISLGAYLWFPINSYTGTFSPQVGESSWRVLPKLVMGGLASKLLWSFTFGFYYRPDQRLGTLLAGSGNTMGSEIQFGAALAYANTDLRLSIGPEALLSTIVTNSLMAGGENPAFKQSATSLELLLGIHYNIASVIQLSVGGGIGLFREPGNPDGRVMLRLGYAPIRKLVPEKKPDGDDDGIEDMLDACPNVPGVPSADPQKHGCPLPRDTDQDGVFDPEDRCVDEHQGENPDPQRPGCPRRDSDKDGLFDEEDLCPEEHQGGNPDPQKPGCPLRDSDKDGVFDFEDLCVDVIAGPHPDPNRKGCPDIDTDGDTIFDGYDQCKSQAPGLNPDPERLGCPLPDQDGDLVPDRTDACPDKPGAPSADPKKNGCPGLVEVKAGMIRISQQIFFATNKDTILKKSFPILDAVATVLKAIPTIKKVAIEGHTDNKGKPDKNLDLSDRRAKSVRQWLIDHGIDAGRLEAKGYGQERPIADNKSGKGRAQNRRVDFRIIDPPPTSESAQQQSASPVQAPPADQKAQKADDKKGKKGKKKKKKDK